MKPDSQLTQQLKLQGENELCRICGHKFLYLGSHVWHKHKILSKAYKERFGLPHKFRLFSDEVRDKKVQSYNERRNYYLSNLSKENCFKKGHHARKGQYISKAEMKSVIERINQVNENAIVEQCPVCRENFENLDSHLYNKHKLLRANKNSRGNEK